MADRGVNVELVVRHHRVDDRHYREAADVPEDKGAKDADGDVELRVAGLLGVGAEGPNPNWVKLPIANPLKQPAVGPEDVDDGVWSFLSSICFCILTTNITGSFVFAPGRPSECYR